MKKKILFPFLVSYFFSFAQSIDNTKQYDDLYSIIKNQNLILKRELINLLNPIDLNYFDKENLLHLDNSNKELENYSTLRLYEINLQDKKQNIIDLITENKSLKKYIKQNIIKSNEEHKLLIYDLFIESNKLLNFIENPKPIEQKILKEIDFKLVFSEYLYLINSKIPLEYYSYKMDNNKMIISFNSKYIINKRKNNITEKGKYFFDVLIQCLENNPTLNMQVQHEKFEYLSKRNQKKMQKNVSIMSNYLENNIKEFNEKIKINQADYLFKNQNSYNYIFILSTNKN